MLAQTHMRAIAERQLFVRSTLDIEAEQIGEYVFVAIARWIREHQPVVLGDLLSMEFGLGHCRTHEMLHGRGPADPFPRRGPE